MNDRKRLARLALRGALETRLRAGVLNSDPICVYDLAEKLGVKVRFFCGNSFGGMYSKTSRTILVPALRPQGRQAFTCGHELGHWYFKHGNRIDELDAIEKNYENDPEEQLANVYSGYLLMSPWAVKEAFCRRNWDPVRCTSLQTYVVATQLGVGYETLIQHLRWSINLVSHNHAESLLKTNPKRLRRLVLGFDHSGYLVIADQAWTKVPIDLRVGDLTIMPENIIIEGKSIAITGKHKMGLLVEAVAPGISRAESSNGTWATFIRVSRKEFEGLYKFRHLEGPDVD